MNRKRTIVLSVLLAVAGCATNPVSGRHEFSLVTANKEIEIGRDGYAAILSEYGVYDDPKVAAYVDSVGQALARVSHLPSIKWTFTVLDDPTVNAFAMPGGYIYVTRGILAHLESEAQLAGVLGHEIGHVTARHTAQRITQQGLAGLGLSIASLVSTTFQRYSGAAQTALQLVFLKYGRDDETQADELGVDYATKANYDPREIPATYAMLKRVSEAAGQRLPAFLSTHPDPGNREQRTRELATAAIAGKSGLEVRGRGYLSRLDHMVFGRDPRQGYFEGERFYHPQFGFELSFPAGWKLQDTHASVSAAEPNQRAVMEMTLADAGTLTPPAFVTELQRRSRIADARGAQDPVGGYDAWVGHVAVAGQDGAQSVLAAGFVRTHRDRMLQFLGRSAAAGDADELSIFTSMRSLRPLADPSRLAATPDRVSVVRLSTNGTFQEVVPKLGAQALDVSATSILNEIQPDEDVRAGQLLKIVVPGKRR